MASVIFLILIVVVALIVVRAGAVALELTGMERDKAWFQALSAFTTTGFTTLETEEIVRFPVRRRIVGVLIILGYAGSVTVIATLVSTLLQRDPGRALLNVAVMGCGLYLIYLLARWRGLTKRIRQGLRQWLKNRYGLQAPSLEEMLQIGAGVGVVRLMIQEDFPLANRPLSELGLPVKRVQILAIQHGDRMITVPQGKDVLQVGDVVICYGDIEAARTVFTSKATGPSPP